MTSATSRATISQATTSQATTSPAAAAPAVVVVTLNWNRAADTIACVESLQALDYRGLRIIVCDNDSKPDSVQEIRAWATRANAGLPEWRRGDAPSQDGATPRLRLIHTGANLGYAGGINVGIRHAMACMDFDYVWVLNNDTEVAADSLRALIDRMEADPAIGICGSSLVCHGRRDRVQAHGGASYLPWRAQSQSIGAFSDVADLPAKSDAAESRMAYVNGAAMLVRRDYLDQIGLMDETYFLYSEEHDWAERGKNRFRLGYAPRSIVFHKHGATIGTSPAGGSRLSLFYLYRSKLMFVARHHPACLPTAVVALLWDALKLSLQGHPGKSLAALQGMLAAPRRGVFHEK